MRRLVRVGLCYWSREPILIRCRGLRLIGSSASCIPLGFLFFFFGGSLSDNWFLDRRLIDD